MKKLLIILISILTLLFSCNTLTKKNQDEKAVNQIDRLLIDSSRTLNPIEETLKTLPKNIKPVFGYRFETVAK